MSEIPPNCKKQGIDYVLNEKNQLQAIVICKSCEPKQTTFFTENDKNPQAGFIVYKKGDVIRHHSHRLSLTRKVFGTPETILVRKGSLLVELFDRDSLVVNNERLLKEGDVIILFPEFAGHGFRCVEDVVLLEVKQGPYAGRDEDKVFYDEKEIKKQTDDEKEIKKQTDE